MMVGSFGMVVFETSADLIRTLDDFQRSGQAQYAEHARIGNKALLQFVAPSLESVTFKMLFCAEIGVNPRIEINKLRTMRDQGIAAPLILDGRPLAKYVIQSLSETWKRLDNRGGLHSAEVQVSLKEYVEAAS